MHTFVTRQRLKSFGSQQSVRPDDFTTGRWIVNSRISLLGVVCLTAVAFAGTPCPDPFSAKPINVACVSSRCYVPNNLGGTVIVEGYLAPDAPFTQGGCKSPGNSANTCSVSSTPSVRTVAVQLGTLYDCTNGQILSSDCSKEYISYTRKDGHSTSEQCDYCRTTSP